MRKSDFGIAPARENKKIPKKNSQKRPKPRRRPSSPQLLPSSPSPATNGSADGWRICCPTTSGHRHRRRRRGREGGEATESGRSETEPAIARARRSRAVTPTVTVAWTRCPRCSPSLPAVAAATLEGGRSGPPEGGTAGSATYRRRSLSLPPPAPDRLLVGGGSPPALTPAQRGREREEERRGRERGRGVEKNEMVVPRGAHSYSERKRERGEERRGRERERSWKLWNCGREKRVDGRKKRVAIWHARASWHPLLRDSLFFSRFSPILAPLSHRRVFPFSLFLFVF